VRLHQCRAHGPHLADWTENKTFRIVTERQKTDSTAWVCWGRGRSQAVSALITRAVRRCKARNDPSAVRNATCWCQCAHLTCQDRSPFALRCGSAIDDDAREKQLAALVAGADARARQCRSRRSTSTRKGSRTVRPVYGGAPDLAQIRTPRRGSARRRQPGRAARNHIKRGTLSSAICACWCRRSGRDADNGVLRGISKRASANARRRGDRAVLGDDAVADPFDRAESTSPIARVIVRARRPPRQYAARPTIAYACRGRQAGPRSIACWTGESTLPIVFAHALEVAPGGNAQLSCPARAGAPRAWTAAERRVMQMCRTVKPIC